VTDGLVQVTLGDSLEVKRRLVVVRDKSKPIQALIDDHVGQSNGNTSDLRQPPANLSFLEALDGKAVVLRMHHALYDAWSIKMIEKDFRHLLAFGKVPQARQPLECVVRQIRDMEDLEAEKDYWKRFLSHAQDTVLKMDAEGEALSAPTHAAPLGTHFKVHYPSLVPHATLDAFSRTQSRARVTAAVILAYARTLGQFTGRCQPAFGLNHASRSLCSPNGTQTLDLTTASVPTLTVTPFCVDLGGQRAEALLPETQLLDAIEDHLAELTKFAQSDAARRFWPRFNSYINIIYPGDVDVKVEDQNSKTGTNVLCRHRLGEPLATEYFTITEPSMSTMSTIEGLDTSHLCPNRFFLNIIVHEGQGLSVTATGDSGLCGGDVTKVANIVSHFGSELTRIIRGPDSSW
jgi:hypothetical protein